MFQNPGRFVVVRFLLLVVLILVRPDAAQAQVTGQLSEKPIAIFYARDITQKRALTYVMNFTERMSFAESIRGDLASEIESQEEADPEVQNSVDGYAIYLVSGVIPSLESVSFCNVNDVADAKRLLGTTSKNHILKELENNCFIVESITRNTTPLPEGADESKLTFDEGDAMESNGITQSSHEVSQAIEEKDGKKFIVSSSKRRSFHRVYDQYLYEGESEKLFNMPLPTAADISAGINETNDLGFSIYLDRVSKPIRELGWNMVSSGFGAQLQQHDGETDTSYNMRRAFGELGLGVLNAALFDIDFSDASLRLATEDTQSIEGDLRIRARNNSSMGDKLQRAIGDSRFAPILHDNAAVTNHTCIRLPEDSSRALSATGDWLKETFATEFSNDPAMISAAETLAETLAGIAEHRNLELLLKVGWTEESAGVIYGGIQLHDNPQLLPSIYQIMVHGLSELTGDTSLGIAANDQTLKMIKDGDMEFIRIMLPQDSVDAIAENCGARITHIYLAHQNSGLWFAAGGETAKEIIRLSVARCHESNATRAPYLSAKIDMEQWLAYPQDDPSGIAQMPHWLDVNSWWFPPNPFIAFVTDFESPEHKPRTLMRQAFELGGSQQFSLTLNADESGLLLQMSLGEALANHLLARFIDFQVDE